MDSHTSTSNTVIIVEWDKPHFKGQQSFILKVLHNLMLTMDSLSSGLYSKGIGAQRRCAEIITHYT